MQEAIFNEPLIAQFFKHIPPKDKYITSKELILLGIDALNARIPKSTSNQPLSQQVILLQIETMKRRIEQLAAILEGQNTTAHFKIMGEEDQQKVKPITIQDQNCHNFQKNIQVNHTEYGDREAKENITPKVTEVAPIPQIEKHLKFQNKNQISPPNKTVNRHHLDDSQVRKALTNPFAKQTPPKKFKKQKKYLYQEELDKAEMKELLIAQQEEGLGRSKRSKTSIANNMIHTLKAESKIKDLVAKDRMKYKEVHNVVDYQKYEYSSEDDNPYDKIQEEESQSSANQQSFNQKATVPHFQVNKAGSKSNNRTNSKNFSHSSSSFNKQQRTSEKKQMKSKKRTKKEESSDTYSDFKYEERNNRFVQKSEKSQGQNEKEDDLISESSSFSKFSLGSQREVGKIGVRR